jgi:transcriptional regulator with XRE-family HTH domain
LTGFCSFWQYFAVSKKPNFKKLGELAKARRLDQGMSQDKFAEVVGLSVRTIIRVEQGESLGDLARVKLEKYLALQGQAV